MSIVLIATLDTKGQEAGFVRDCLREKGLEVVVIDAGSIGPPTLTPDITREQVFERASTSLEAIHKKGDRGHAVARAAEGAAAVVVEMHRKTHIEGVFSLGGSAGTTIGTAAMRALPFGLPKVMVSTLASGQTRPFVGGSDIAMFNPVADLAGLNRLTRTALANAAHALAGMVLARREGPRAELSTANRPVVAATMFGVTTPCVDCARQVLDMAGYEVLVFHATGVGGQAMETLIRDGQVAGVLDITTTELADEIVGGILSAGPDRLEAAGRIGIPQVVSLGALDMVNFGPLATVPERFRGRTLHVHNPNVTLMRTTAEENATLGTRIASVLARAKGPAAVLIPEGGVSALDAPGQPFYDPQADTALFEALERGLASVPAVRIIRVNAHINSQTFAEAAAHTLLALLPDPADEED